MDRRAVAVLSVAVVVGLGAGAGTALRVGVDDAGRGDDQRASPAASTATSTAARTVDPLWTTTTELHDGDTVVPLEGVGFVTALRRSGDHWIVQDVPEGRGEEVSPRVLRVDRDGRVIVLAEVAGAGDVDDAGTRHVGIAPDGRTYQVTDLASGDTTRLPRPGGVAGPNGTSAFVDGDVVTGWNGTGTTYHRSAVDGTGREVVGRSVEDARFSADGRAYVGLQVGLDEDCVVGGPAGDGPGRADQWRHCPGSLAASSPYAPDGGRLVAPVLRRGEGHPERADVLDAATGELVASVPLPDDVFDVALLGPALLGVMVVTGPDGDQVTTVHTCDLSGDCRVAGSAEGVAVLGDAG